MLLNLDLTEYAFGRDTAFSHDCLSTYITGVIPLLMFCNTLKLNCLWNVLIPSADRCRRERSETKKECSVREKKRKKQGRDRERHKEKKMPAQLICTEDLSHDLNILGDKICPHCRNYFLSKPCSFSSARGMHQCSIVSVCCDHIVLPHGCKVQSNNTFAMQHNSKGT